MIIAGRHGLAGVCTILLMMISMWVNASSADSHSKWFDVASIHWVSHKPAAGIATQVKLMNTYVLVKMSDGSVKKVWAAKITLKDGRTVQVDKGRLLHAGTAPAGPSEKKVEKKIPAPEKRN